MDIPTSKGDGYRFGFQAAGISPAPDAWASGRLFFAASLVETQPWYKNSFEPVCYRIAFNHVILFE